MRATAFAFLTWTGGGAASTSPTSLSTAHFQQTGLVLAGPFANLVPGNYLAWLTGTSCSATSQ